MKQIIETLRINGKEYHIRFSGKPHAKTGKMYYYYHVTLHYGNHPITGKQVQRQLTSNTLAGIKDKLYQELGIIAPNLQSPYKSLTVNKWLEYTQGLKSVALDPSSIRSYNSIIKRHILPHIGDKLLIELSEQDMIEYFKTLKRNGKDNNQIRSIHALLQNSFNVAVHKKIIAYSPCLDIEMPRQEIRERLPIWEEQYNDFAKLAKETDYYELFIIMLGTGMRIGEALGLSWDDVLREQQELFIHQQALQRDENGKSCRKIKPVTKSRRPRFIPYADDLNVFFDSLKARQDAYFSENPDLWSNPNNLVFTDSHGNQLVYGTVQAALKRVASGIGRLDISLHSLRHTFLTFLYDETGNIVSVQKIAGHKSISTTLRYIHCSSKQKRELRLAVSKMFQQMRLEALGY